MQNLKRNLLIAASIFLGGTFAWFGIVYWPKHAEVGQLRGKIGQSTLLVEGLLAQDQQIAGLQSQIDSTRQAIVNLEQRIYPKAAFPEMANIIEQRGKLYGLHFSAIAPDYDALLRLDMAQRQEYGPLVVLPVEFTVQGNFIDLGRFTESLGSLPFLFSITKLDVEATAESYPQVLARMQGVLYLTEAPVKETPVPVVHPSRALQG